MVTVKPREKLYGEWSYILIALFFGITLSYILIRQDDIYLQIHDYLDSNVVWMKMMKDNHIFLNNDVLVPFLGGIDRNYLYSELKAYTWLHMLFPTFPAIVIGWYMKILMAIVGFVYLGKSFGGDEMFGKRPLLVWCGFLYGVAPTYPPVAFAFASLPFLLGILIRCYQKFSWKYIIALLFYPILSDFSLFGIFICGYLVLFLVAEWLVKKRPCWTVCGYLGALIVGYVVVEWRLFDALFLSGEKSLHSLMIEDYVNVLTALKDVAMVFVRGYYHCGSLHTYVVLPICIIYLFIVNRSYLKNRQYKQLVGDVVNWLFLWIVFNCIVYGLNELQLFREWLANVIPLLGGFNIGRTIWFNPFLWYFLFFLVLSRIKWEMMVCAVAILAGVVVCVGPETYNQIFFNCLLVACDVVGEEKVEALVGRELELLTYKEFYSEQLFEEIKEDIGYDGEWSVVFGMHPAILEYNGIFTLDGYLSYYPQSYKEQFRKLIEPELSIDSENREYFDSWGGRAYLYSDEISYNPAVTMSQEEADLHIDSSVFREMDGKYIFSRVQIRNADELGIELEKKYRQDESPYVIYLYVLRN